MTNRTEKRFNSLSLPNGFRFGYYPGIKAISEDLKENTDEKITELINRQLAAHVTATWARDQFTTDLERVTGFHMLTEEKVSKKDPTKSTVVPTESELEYVNRFRKEYMASHVIFTPATNLGQYVGKPDNQDDEVSIADALSNLALNAPAKTLDAVDQWLQQLADLREYPLDARVVERVGREKGLPKYATEGAALIYAGNDKRDSRTNWEHWQKTFKKESGVVLADYTGNKDVDLKVLALAIVANENSLKANKYK